MTEQHPKDVTREETRYEVTPSKTGEKGAGFLIMRIVAVTVWIASIFAAIEVGKIRLPQGQDAFGFYVIRETFSFWPFLCALVGGVLSGCILWAVGELMGNVHQINQSLLHLDIRPIPPVEDTPSPVKMMTCSACGTRQRADRTFCEKCTADLAKSDDETDDVFD